MKKGNKNLILFSMVFVLIIGIIYMWNINMGKTSTQVKETISFLEELSDRSYKWRNCTRGIRYPRS